MAKREELLIIDPSSNEFRYTILPNEAGGKQFGLIQRPWQLGDPETPWRIPLHDFSDGMGADRLSGRNTYRELNGQILKDGTIVPAPKVYTHYASAISHTSYNSGGSTTTTLTITAPDDIEDDDCLIAIIQQSDKQAITATGWTLVAEYDATGGSTGYVAVYRKIASSESGNYDFTTASAPTWWAGSIHVYDVVDTTTPVEDSDVLGSTWNGSDASTLTIPTVSPSTGAGKFLCFVSQVGTITNSLLTFSNGFDEWGYRGQGGGTSDPPLFEQHTFNSADNSTFDVTVEGVSEQVTEFVAFVLYLKPETTDPVSTGYPIRLKKFSKGLLADKLFITSTSNAYVYHIDSIGMVVADKPTADIGAIGTDIVIFDNEIIQCLEDDVSTEYLWKRDDASNRPAWTQSSDALARNAARVDDKIWRIVSPNLVSNCAADPETDANWVPASGNEYNAGESSHNPLALVSYDGAPWVIKQDGVYAPDQYSFFRNQTPQLQGLPSIFNGANPFLAQGYLFVPTRQGLLRLQLGESIAVGPETKGIPYYDWWFGGGVSYGSKIYLIGGHWNRYSVTGFPDVQPNRILVMTPATSDDYIIHHVTRTGTFGVANLSDGNNEDDVARETLSGDMAIRPIRAISPDGMTAVVPSPSIDILYWIEQESGNLRSIRLVSSADRACDSDYYYFGDSGNMGMRIRTGPFSPTQQKTIQNTLVGVDILAKGSSHQDVFDGLYEVDDYSPQNELLTTAMNASSESGGATSITPNGAAYEWIKLYAARGATGSFFDIEISVAVDSDSADYRGVDHPEIKEIWAFGTSHPERYDEVTLNILGDKRAAQLGVRQGYTSDEILRQFRDWANEGTVLELRIPEYDESTTTRFVVVGVSETIVHQSNIEHTKAVEIKFMRVDYANAYAD